MFNIRKHALVFAAVTTMAFCGATAAQATDDECLDGGCAAIAANNAGSYYADNNGNGYDTMEKARFAARKGCQKKLPNGGTCTYDKSVAENIKYSFSAGICSGEIFLGASIADYSGSDTVVRQKARDAGMLPCRIFAHR